MHVSIPAYGVASYAAGPQEVTVTAADVTGGSEDGSGQNGEQAPTGEDRTVITTVSSRQQTAVRQLQ